MQKSSFCFALYDHEGYNVLDGGELTIPTTEAPDNWQDILVKNSLQCGAVARKVSYRISRQFVFNSYMISPPFCLKTPK